MASYRYRSRRTRGEEEHPRLAATTPFSRRFGSVQETRPPQPVYPPLPRANVVQRQITDDLDALIGALPPRVAEPLKTIEGREGLLEVVMDLGRLPEARFPGREVVLSEDEVTPEDIDFVVSRIAEFGGDNRAGIARTLHRISCIRNRKGQIVGLTCRIGRAVYGTIAIIRDIVESGRSVLLLGRPGVGKTTMLREVGRVLADDLRKRVVIVDTSNEIAGDGDIPHPGIGRARRMQVPSPAQQHAVMIEAVENHMPEVIIIDEIGNELEAAAARTIAERGVQLVGTAHGNSLENLMLNPTLSDLIGGIQSVTLSDEEARRRGTQKSILERKAPPTFDVVVEIQSWDQVSVHPDVALTVDSLLRGQSMPAQVRSLGENGEIAVQEQMRLPATEPEPEPGRGERRHPRGEEPVARFVPAPRANRQKAVRVYPYGITAGKIEEAARDLQLPVEVTKDVATANAAITLKNYYKRQPDSLVEAEDRGVPVYVLKSNTLVQIEQCLASLFDLDVPPDPVQSAIAETQEAINQVLGEEGSIELAPQNAYIRRLQHQMAEQSNLGSRSEGREPFRRVRIFRGQGNGED